MQVNTASPEMDAKAKALVPPKGKSLVYIVRPTFLGKPFSHDITCDKVRIGSTCGGYYIFTVINPGKHIFTSKCDNTSEFELMTDAGKTYYLEESVYPGVLKGIVKLSEADQTAGKKKLGECKLSGDNTAGI